MTNNVPVRGRDALGRFLPGHPAWTHLVYRGSFPARIRQLTKTIRDSLIREKGGLDRCSIGDLVRIDKLVALLQITFGIEKLIRTRGMFIDGRLDPILSGDYLGYCREVRNYLKDLGVRQSLEAIMTPAELLEAVAMDVEAEDVQEAEKLRRNDAEGKTIEDSMDMAGSSCLKDDKDTGDNHD